MQVASLLTLCCRPDVVRVECLVSERCTPCFKSNEESRLRKLDCLRDFCWKLQSEFLRNQLSGNELVVESFLLFFFAARKVADTQQFPQSCSMKVLLVSLVLLRKRPQWQGHSIVQTDSKNSIFFARWEFGRKVCRSQMGKSVSISSRNTRLPASDGLFY